MVPALLTLALMVPAPFTIPALWTSKRPAVLAPLLPPMATRPELTLTMPLVVKTSVMAVGALSGGRPAPSTWGLRRDGAGPPLALVAPAPFMLPPLHVVSPLTVTGSVPARMPALSFRVVVVTAAPVLKLAAPLLIVSR